MDPPKPSSIEPALDRVPREAEIEELIPADRSVLPPGSARNPALDLLDRRT
jgi:hypothetical protein